MAGTWSSSLDIFWTPRALFKTLPRENFSLCLLGASRGPLNLVSDSAPFPYVRQNWLSEIYQNCRHVVFLPRPTAAFQLHFRQPASWNRTSSHHPGLWENLLFLCASVWVLSIDLALSSLILSSAVSNLLMSLTNAFFTSVMGCYISSVSIWLFYSFHLPDEIAHLILHAVCLLNLCWVIPTSVSNLSLDLMIALSFRGVLFFVAFSYALKFFLCPWTLDFLM